MFSDLLLLIVGPLVLLPLAGYALKRRQIRGAAWYALLLVALSWWSAAYAWELAASRLDVKIAALQLKYVGVVALPVAWIGFILAFVDVEVRVIHRITGAMTAVACVMLALAWTNALHGLFWGPISTYTTGSATVLRGVGPGFFVNISYTYAALAAGLLVLVVHAVRSPYLYRTRAVIIVTAALLPWLGNVIFLIRRAEAPLVDPTPLLFSASAVLAALAVFRYHLLDPIPTLRDVRLEVMSDAVIILDPSGRVADLNPAAEAILGQRRADATGVPLEALLPGWHRGEEDHARYDLTLSGPSRTTVYDLQRSAVRAPDGRVTGAVVVLRDVTLRRLAEQALRDSERRYRDLVEHADDLIVTLTLSGRIQGVNRACQEITGYAPDELIGRHVLRFVAPSDRARVAGLLRVPPEGGRARADLIVVARNGRSVALEASGWPQYRGGQPVAVQCIARDETRRMRLETELRQSQKMEAVGQLAGGVAHDFNNLMTSIIGFATLALEHVPYESPARAWLQQVLRSADQASAVTRQLLAFGRRQMLQPVVLDLNGVVEETAHILKRLIPENIALLTRPAPFPVAVHADSVQLQQVILNLVVNARDAMPSGGTIAIGTNTVVLPVEHSGNGGPDLPPGAYAVLSVSDTGVGIEDSVAPHVFEPFFTTKAHGKGTGLGLATVHGIVKQSGGDVTLKSTLGAGTTFTIYLPVAEEPVAGSSPESRGG